MNQEEYAQMYRLEDRHWWFVARRHLLTRALEAFLRPSPAAPRSPRLLDVGCGTGGTLDRLRPYGEVVGLDLEPLALRFCRERGWRTLVQGSATALPFADNSFDAVVALDVLEHIPDDARAAAEIGRVLAPGGILLVTVPAYRSFWSGHDVALMHQRRYVAREVEALLRGAGLKVEQLTYTVSALLPLVWLIRRAQRLLRPNAPPRADAAVTGEPLNGLLRALLQAENHLALRCRIPFGLTVFAVARKQ